MFTHSDFAPIFKLCIDSYLSFEPHPSKKAHLNGFERPSSWGQQGEFLIEVAGIRALVRCSDGFSWTRFHLDFHAVDMHGPFNSETGYQRRLIATAPFVEGADQSCWVCSSLRTSKPFCESLSSRAW